ncbi:uncharacterized protein LOC113233944 [Hyposmocoma kahamanoa]|uniref:uncharacterized protein LOC113233944 n=1 Tax=Hyposmocoma kahamanoa TaxID=1477025 RepID=UPI000E6D83AB|nr:uncharacterized protein LOC113233944 [Hyposmocoma kahamanoa]
MNILQICFMLSSVVGLVGGMYYIQPVKKVIEDFDSAEYEYKLIDDINGASLYTKTLEGRTTFKSGQSSIYEIITQPSNLGTTKAFYEYVNDLQEATDAGHVENSLAVEETTTSVIDISTAEEQYIYPNEYEHTNESTVDEEALQSITYYISNFATNDYNDVVESHENSGKRKQSDFVKREIRQRNQTRVKPTFGRDYNTDRKLMNEIRALLRKYKLRGREYLLRLPRGFSDDPFPMLFKPTRIVQFIHRIPRYNFKFQRVNNKFSAFNENYRQGGLMVGFAWSSIGIVLCLTSLLICFTLRAIKLTRKSYKIYRIVLSLLSTGVLAMSTSSVGQIGYTEYLKAFDTLFRIKNYISKNGYEFELFGQHMRNYKYIYNNLDKYFNPVIKSLPELHKLNIDTTKLEREIKILRLFANQTDFRDRLKMGILYNEFIQSLRRKAEISVTAKALFETLPLLLIVFRYGHVKKIIKVCKPIKPTTCKCKQKYDVSRLRLRSKSILILSRPGVHYIPHKRQVVFDKFKSYSIEGDGSSMACR